MAFRENILHLRAASNMTQEQLAVLVGVSRQSVAKWEAGKAYPEMDKLIKLSQIFNCTIDELVQGDLTGQETVASVVVSDTPQDLFGYDEFMRDFARRICNGVMSIILGVALGTLFFMIGDGGDAFEVAESTESIMTIVGEILVLAGVALGLALIIPAGLSHAAFVQEHPYLEDFYTQTQKQQARQDFSRKLVWGIICIIAGVSLTVAFSLAPQLEVLSVFALLVMVAVGVRLIMSGGMELSRVDIAAYNRTAQEVRASKDYADGLSEGDSAMGVPGEPVDPKRHRTKTGERIGACCGIVMIIATIIGLVMLFVPGYQSELFWLAWPIGGMCCGIVALIFKAFTGEGA